MKTCARCSPVPSPPDPQRAGCCSAATGAGRGCSPHHDANAIQDVAGTIPFAGFFAQGELGPVAGQNYIHGFTASVALFGAEGERPA